MTAVWEVDNKNVLIGITVVVVVKVAVVVTMIIMMGVVVSISCSTTAVLMMREVALMLSRSIVHVQRKERSISKTALFLYCIPNSKKCNLHSHKNVCYYLVVV